jgi:hypothetical protein
MILVEKDAYLVVIYQDHEKTASRARRVPHDALARLLAVRSRSTASLAVALSGAPERAAYGAIGRAGCDALEVTADRPRRPGR